MDVFKSFYDFLRLLIVFLEPLFSILAWLIGQGYPLVVALVEWCIVHITKQVPSHCNGRVKSSDLTPGRFLGQGCSGIIYETSWSRETHGTPLLARKAFPAVPAVVFETEAARLVDLDHPNIVKTWGWTVDRRSCSLITEHMKYDLFSVVEKRKEAVEKRKEAMETAAEVAVDPMRFYGRSSLPFPLRDAVNIMLQIALGMEYVHDQNLAHGDLKPNNVLVDSETGSMSVKVADFGMTETKKRSTALVSYRARCTQILKWKAPELFEGLLGSSTDDPDNMWTETFPHSAVLESAGSEMQRADIYSYALTCSYILGALPCSSNLGLLELRKGIASDRARPLLPDECPKMLESMISACWNNIPSRRPVFQDIRKNLRAVEWDLQQREAQVQEHLILKPEGSRKQRLKSVTYVFYNRKKRLSVNFYYDQHKQLHTDIVDGEQVPTLGTFANALEKEFSSHVPQLPLGRLSNDARVSFEISRSKVHWSEIQTRSEDFEELRKEQFLIQAQFDKLKGHPLIGHFFSDVNESELELGKRISEGGQAEIYEGQWRGHDGEFYTRAFKVFKTGFMALEYIPLSVFQFFTSNAIVANLSTSRVMRPLGATLLKDGRFALVMERYWGDLHKLMDIQTLKNKLGDPPFREEVAIEIMLQIAEGMAELHESGIIHRDIKAPNVLVRDVEKFNAEGNQGSISCALTDYECSIGVVGTRFWRAPEILDAIRRGKFRELSFAPSADVYSYGMTCYEILTGEIPLYELASTDYDFILCGSRPELPTNVHPHVRDLLTRCWYADPLQRPSSQEIVALLKKLRESYNDVTPDVATRWSVHGGGVVQGEDRLLE